MTRVLFVVPKNRSMLGSGTGITGFPHVGIAYLAAVLKKNKISVKIFDEGIGRKEKELYSLIDEFNPNVIGVTGFSYGYELMEEAVKRLKSYRSDISLIVGGPHVAATDGEILKTTQADFAMTGEGEITFLDFLRQLEKSKSDFAQVPNLLWRKGKTIIKNPLASPIKDLDRIPFPDFEEFELEKYPCFQEKILPIITSRGCPYACNYCSVRLSMGQGFRPRSPQNVVTELKYWYKKGFRSFDINDDCFTLDIKRAENICDLVIKNRLKIKFQLYNGIRVDRVTLPLLKKMKRAGCTFISYGCESGNQEILKKIKKGITLDQVKKAVDWTNQAGIKNSVNFIIGHKEETYEQALDSLRFAESLPTNFVNFYNLVPYPGTESYEWAIKHAKFLVPKETFLKEIGYRDNVPIFETKKFTKIQRGEIVKKGLKLYKRKVLQFRFGKVLGLLIYGLMRVRLFDSLAQWLVYGNRYGMRLYQLLTKKSKN